jgi:hypothetical protein
MFENPLGMPDALPSGYGYADAQPATVRLNASTSRGNPTAVRNPANPTLNNPAALGSHQMPMQTAVVRLSDIERDEDSPKVVSYAPRVARDQTSDYGAAKKGGKKKTDVKSALDKAAGVLSAAGKTAQAVADVAGGKSAKFQDSGAAAPPSEPTVPTENVGSVPSFWQKKYVGVPTWGWATAAGVLVAGGGFLWWRSTQKAKAAAAPPAPKAEKKAAAPAPAPAPAAPAVEAKTEGGE